MTATPAYAVPLRKRDSNVGFETDEGYFRQAEKRIWEERRQLTLDFEE